MYQLSDATQLGFNYNYAAKHDFNMGMLGLVKLNFPQITEIGLQHQITADLAIMANAHWQKMDPF